MRTLPAATVTIQTDTPLVWQLGRATRGVLVNCERLELVLEADDATEAQSLVEEGLQQFFLDHVEEGTFDELLARLGWNADLPEGQPVLEFVIPWRLST